MSKCVGVAGRGGDRPANVGERTQPCRALLHGVDSKALLSQQAGD